MNKSELLSTYAAEQLAEMVVTLEIILAQKENTEQLIKQYKNKKDNHSGQEVKIIAKCPDCGKSNMFELDEKSEKILRNKLTDSIHELEEEVEKYRKAFEEAKKERDCQIAEYQKKIEELKVENAELHCEMQAMKVFPDEIPEEPIKAAEMLITAKGECEPMHIGNDVFKDTYRIFGVSELRQIAEHLLIYCNHNREVEE